MNLSVIGQGYVGLTVAISAAENGHMVIGLDLNKSLVDDLLNGRSYVPGINEERLLPLIKAGEYFPTTDEKSLQNSEVIVIAVPTPLDLMRNPDLSYLEAATKLIAKNVNRSALVVNESTSYPGTLRNFIKPILDEASNQKFLFAVAPERVDPGNLEWNIKNTPRVISGLNDEATSEAIKFYSTFCSSIYKAPNPEVAEASKLLENTFRQVNIALVNEFSEIANLIGFSASEAVKAASTKPFGFMPFFPSIGVGGHCIPVDPNYLRYAASQFGSITKFIDLANQINLSMANSVAIRIQDQFNGELKGISIQLAGIAYKPGVPDLRESPALLLMEELSKLGATVTWCDPLVIEYKTSKSMPLDPNIDLGLIVTPQENIDFSIWKNAGTRVFDLSPDRKSYGWPKFF
jgi:UDP-N-acetyl-D-glucosamine dehydrogenase